MSGLPQGWVAATLEEISGVGGLVSDGDWIESKDQDPEGSVRLIQLMDIGDGHFTNRSNRFLNEETAERLRCTKLCAGDVLIARMPDPLGRACVFPGVGQEAVTAVDVLIWRAGQDGAVPEWLKYAINSPDVRDDLALKAGGTTRQRVAGGVLKKLELPVSPLAEQRRIVAKLDALTARTARARADLDRIPALAARYKQSVLAQAFSGELTAEWRKARGRTLADWSMRSVSEVANVVTGMTPPASERATSFGGEIAFFKPTELDQGYHLRDARETLTDAGASKSRRVPALSTLVTCIGATIGKTGLARVDCCMNQQINAMTTRGDALPEWLYWVTISPSFQDQIIENASATTLPIINKGRFEKLLMPLAPTDEQNHIIRRIEVAFAEIDRLVTEAAAARRLLDRLDQAILAKAFRGELVPQDPADEPASVLLDRIRAERAAAPKTKRGRKAALA